MTNPDLLALANELDDIETDAGGKRNWSEVATVSAALRRLASSEDGVKGEPEPVAWQYRFRPRGGVEWSEWGDCGPGNRAPKMRTNAYEIEERALYTAPPAGAGMREACLRILPYLRWTISDESPGHHPTMPSAVAEFEAALTAPGATTKSDGGDLPPDWKQDQAETTRIRPSDPSSTRSEVAFKFDRYINGELMAEGVTIERQPDLESAMRSASKIAARGPNGETPVLVLASREDEITISDALQPLDDIHVRDGFCDWADVATARDEIRALLDQFEIRRK